MLTTVTVVATLLLALLALASAVAKLGREARVFDNLTRAGVPARAFPYLAGLLLVGAVGLLVGLWWPPLAVAAAVGLTLYFLGAVGAHLRARDDSFVPPLVLTVLSSVVLGLRLLAL